MNKNVLVFVSHYLPGFKGGGPTKSIVNIVDNLGDFFNFYIITKNHDFGSNEPYDGVQTGIWVDIGKAKVMYIDPSFFGLTNFSSLVCDLRPCVVYLNSFFDFFFSIRFLVWRLFKRYKGSVLLAPRGEFSSGALSLKSVKKKAYISLAKIIGLLRGVSFHATTHLETIDIKKALSPPDASILEALVLPSAFKQIYASNSVHVNEINPRLHLIFMSRISRKKNLDYAILCLRDVSIPLVFDIYGPDEDQEYWSECNLLIATLPSHVEVRYIGAVNPHETAQVFSSYDLFFFPTRGENYGHVIAESLTVGTPVLISDQTPWLDLERDGTGWALPLSSKSAFVDKIEYLAALSPEKRLAMRERVIEGAKKRILNPQHVEDNRRMFYELCSKNT